MDKRAFESTKRHRAGLLALSTLGAAGSSGCHPSVPPGRHSASIAEYSIRNDDTGLVVDALVENAKGPLVPTAESAPYLTRIEGDTTGNDPCARSCRFSYRVDYRRAAERLAASRDVWTDGESIALPTAAWLVRPRMPSLSMRVHVTTDEKVPGQPRGPFLPFGPRFGARTSFLWRDADVAPWSALGPWDARAEVHGGSVITSVVARAAWKRGTAVMHEAMHRKVAAFASYLGRVPVPSVLILTVPSQRAFGEARLGSDGASILLLRSPSADSADDAASWIPTHELIHLAVPKLDGRHRWFDEGLATYLEPLVRAAAGELRAEDVFDEWMREMPSGQPTEGASLDQDSGWQRTYWGGALYFFAVDVELRRATRNRFGVRDWVAAWLRTDVNGFVRLEGLERLFDLARRESGSDAARAHYAMMGARAGSPDLPALFRDLGAGRRDGRVHFDDSAPLAWVRQGLVTGGSTATHR